MTETKKRVRSTLDTSIRDQATAANRIVNILNKFGEKQRGFIMTMVNGHDFNTAPAAPDPRQLPLNGAGEDAGEVM